MAQFEIRLADAIEALRGELQTAVDAGEGKKLRFEVEDLELEFQTVVTKEGTAKGATKGGLKFWIVGGEASTELTGKLSSSQVQTIKLRLKPTVGPARDQVELAG